MKKNILHEKNSYPFFQETLNPKTLKNPGTLKP
jgi:hypothetical protein